MRREETGQGKTLYLKQRPDPHLPRNSAREFRYQFGAAIGTTVECPASASGLPQDA